ncbi:rubrerythrin [Planctomycetota bacterium]|nr:rubrerythrin [Planctomycetota bacterium]
MSDDGAALKDTQTHDNLKAAFSAESQAAARYRYFAVRAEIDGNLALAGLFKAAAAAEATQAHGSLDYLSTVGDPQTNTRVGTSDLNLQSAVEREVYRHETLYASFAQTAREEGFDKIANWFEALARAGEAQAAAFKEALDNLDAGDVAGRD